MHKNKARKPILLPPDRRNGVRAAGKFNASLMDLVRAEIRPGMTTNQIDKLIHDYTFDHGNRPADLGYHGFPKSCCTSVNDVICHGIPDEYVLKEGDIINVDCTTVVDGWYGDSSETFFIGHVSEQARRVCQCSFDALWAAIRRLEPECRVAEIGRAVVETARRYNFSVVEEFVGHGLGYGDDYHTDPTIPHVPTGPSRLVRLMPGMVFTIEPMINEGTRLTQTDPRDKWTVRTQDRKLSAQFEHTLVMTETGPEVLTLTQHGPREGATLVVPATESRV